MTLDNLSIAAIAADHPVEETSVAAFALDDIDGLADFILKRTGLA